MDYAHTTQQAGEYADAALRRIKQDKLAPTPDVFELLYVYYSGQNPEVVRALDSTKQPLTSERCREIHQRFLSESRDEEAVRKAGDQIHETIRDMTGVVREVKSATNSYTGRLDGINRQIQGIKDPEQLRTVLDAVMSDTEAMLRQNMRLEEHLDRSTVAMEILQRDLETVRREALTDGLTGLANRKSFDEALHRVAVESEENGVIFSLLMIDIDHFKSFNDNYGHQVGDQVLRLVARTLTDGVKGRDIAARYGGEEFAIILPETPLNAGVTVGNALRKAVATKEVINRNSGEKLGRITMSVGVAEYNAGESLQDLIARADAALYAAKHNGRNQVASAPTPGKKEAGKKEAG